MGRDARFVRVRAARFVMAAVVVAAGSAAFVWPSTPSVAAGDSSFSGTVNATRTHVITDPSECQAPDEVTKDGCQDESRTVHLTVDRTKNLSDQQQLRVSWTGAHPTSNYWGNPNSSDSDKAEYPMVLLQCRGTVATVTPQTCWAPFDAERQLVTGSASGADNVGTFPAWRLDRYAEAADREAFVPGPELRGLKRPGCPQTSALAEHVLPFVAADGTKFYGSGQHFECGDAPPEAAAFVDSSSVSVLPDNAAFALTNADGSGAYKFNVRSSVTNASLGCSVSVACTLVAIPIVGVSCDPSLDTDDPAGAPDGSYFPDAPATARAACESGAAWPVGAGNQNSPSLAVSGQLWWTASNWRNRISVPLTFAPVADACSRGGVTQAFFGAETAMQATQSWSAKLCQTAGAASFDHVISAEPVARSFVASGAVEAALTNLPATPQFARPTVQAPVAATGFAISYNIDKADGNPYQSLRLTPRLLAKLMTSSYPDRTTVAANHPGLGGNPLNITLDPEFQALNPGVWEVDPSSFGAGSLFSISTPSDVIYALTSYVNADPAARAWLDGQPDPWGMVVNPSYKKLALPVSTWPLTDTWTMPASADPGSTPLAPGCIGRYGVYPQPPYMQLIASPVQSMIKIAQSVEFSQPGESDFCPPANQTIQVPDPVNGSTKAYTAYVRAERQFTGKRFVIGLTSLSDAAYYSLDTAALQTTSVVDPGEKFTDAGNMTFVRPTNASLKAAFGYLAKNDSGGWNLPYDKLRSSGVAAYPGAMLVYADIPTTGLAKADAQAYASILKYVIGPGQVPGTGIGQLPDGYLPLTSANGFADQVAYSTEAVDDVAAQNGLLPGQKSSAPPTDVPDQSTGPSTNPGEPSNPDGPPSNPGGPSSNPEGSPSNPDSPSANPTASFGSGPSSSTGNTTGGTNSPTGSGGAAGSTAPVQSVAGTQPAAEAVGKTTGFGSAAYERLVILLLVLLAVAPLGVPAVLLGRRWRAGR